MPTERPVMGHVNVKYKHELHVLSKSNEQIFSSALTFMAIPHKIAINVRALEKIYSFDLDSTCNSCLYLTFACPLHAPLHVPLHGPFMPHYRTFGRHVPLHAPSCPLTCPFTCPLHAPLKDVRSACPLTCPFMPPYMSLYISPSCPITGR